MYITGGSSGLGLSLAHILAEKGANISIVARNQKKLDEALASLEVSSALHDVHYYRRLMKTWAGPARLASAEVRGVFTCTGDGS